MNNVFPLTTFGVGRGFSLASTGNKDNPWISLNRIYFDNSQSGENQWVTNDKHKGQLVIGYAKTDGSPDQSLDSLSGKTWTGVAGDSGQLGARSGEELRQKVKAFAKQQKVDIKEIYMVDGSHLDARANAFVGGMDGSIIGLYDTLFLGDHSKNYQANDASGFFFMLNGKSGIRKLSE